MTTERTLTDIYESKNESYFLFDRGEMLPYVPKNAQRILDVGCSGGGFGKRLKTERAAEVWGIELNKQAAEIAAQSLDRVFCAEFDRSLNLPSHYFDCIVFNDVIEHIVNPANALLYCKELLRDGGVVVASIPNVRYFENIWNLVVHKDWKYTEGGILDETHLRFFTRRSLLRTFEESGYCVQLIEGINARKDSKLVYVIYWLINGLLLNQHHDMRYLQFAIVAGLPN